MNCCSVPLSPSMRLAPLMRLEKAASEMIRPFQMLSISSYLLTTRSWLDGEVENLRFGMNGRAAPAQFVQPQIDLKFRKPVFHYRDSSSRRIKSDHREC
jgi:hypothetical protein